jgi:hypothetical protein
MVVITSSHPSSVTIASSLALRIRALAPRLHRLGPHPLYQFLAEVVGGAPDPLGRLEAYAAIDAEVLDRFGGREMPQMIKLVVK